MASYRYRAQIPANVLGASVNSGEADIAIFSKPIAGDVELAKQIKGQGVKIVVDFCDDHFDSQIYKDMVGLADKITCASKAMQAVIKSHGHDSEVINDPYEFGLNEPHADGDKLLWFGHQSNLGEIAPLIAKGVPIQVVTGGNDVLNGYTPWSVDNMREKLAEANIVVIPDGKGTRSNNRMINSIAAGCFVLAGKQHDAYRKIIYAGALHHGFQFANCFRAELNDLVKEGQKYAYKHHSPDAVANQWRELCASI